ncbi:MAG TPA: hypothetical protein VGF17_11180, partial [Phytomonospora sp.]
ALAAKSSRIPEPPDTAHQTGTTAAGEREPDDAVAPLVTEEPPTSAVQPPTDPPPSTSDTPAAASFADLCHLFLDDRPKAHRDPGFPLLVEEAGGRRNVGDYCRDLLGVPDDRDEDGDDDGGDDEGEEPAAPGLPGSSPADKGRKPSGERTSVLHGTASHKV